MQPNGLPAELHEFVRVADDLGLALLITDRFGEELHRTLALRAILIGESENESVVGQMRDAARISWERLSSCERESSPHPASRESGRTSGIAKAHQEVVTSSTKYVMFTALCEACFQQAEDAILVRLVQTSPRLPSAVALTKRYGLTRAQANVAVQLLRTFSYDSAADVLGISSHTVRRHGEQIRTKTGTGSLTELVMKLLADG